MGQTGRAKGARHAQYYCIYLVGLTPQSAIWQVLLQYSPVLLRGYIPCGNGAMNG